MSTLNRVRRLLTLDAARLGGRAVERAVDDELAFHLATRVDELIARGLTRDAAEVEARRQFGDVDAARDELARIDHRRLSRRGRLMWLSELAQDVRVALRSFKTQPGFTAVVLITMALGIGANGAIYSVVDAALLRPLPFREPDRLVMISETKFALDGLSRASYPDFIDWRAQSASFERIEGFDGTNVTLLGAGEPVRAQGARVTSGLLP